MYFNRQGGNVRECTVLDSHVLPTINVINYVPRFVLFTFMVT